MVSSETRSHVRASMMSCHWPQCSRFFYTATNDGRGEAKGPGVTWKKRCLCFLLCRLNQIRSTLRWTCEFSEVPSVHVPDPAARSPDPPSSPHVNTSTGGQLTLIATLTNERNRRSRFCSVLTDAAARKSKKSWRRTRTREAMDHDHIDEAMRNEK